jgi:hypothetical protein
VVLDLNNLFGASLSRIDCESDVDAATGGTLPIGKGLGPSEARLRYRVAGRKPADAADDDEGDVGDVLLDLLKRSTRFLTGGRA